MPTLEWLGKERIVAHHLEVPFHVLDHLYGFDSEGQKESATESGNKIIHGDNLVALKSLLPQYERRIDCVYIDPPYNTGKENWVYNDNVKDPRILKWLGEVVGKEGEDFSRHDKWLCMMYPRLALISRLLSPNGKLAISISHHELGVLMMLCRKIFSKKQVVPITVQTSGGKPSAGFNYLHEYVVFVVPEDFTPESLEIFGGKNRTPFEGLTLSTFDKVSRPNQVYPIFIDRTTECIHSVGPSLAELVESGLYNGSLADYEFKTNISFDNCAIIWPITSKGKQCCWRLEPKRLMSDWKKGYIRVTKNKHASCPNEYSINYLPEGVIKKVENGTLQITGKEANGVTLTFGENQTEGSSIPTIWTDKGFYTVKGTTLLGNIFGKKVFDYPKSHALITTILDAISAKDDIILDSFGGSGTTAHAVLSLNEKDEGTRNFILIEMMDYAEDVTAERIRRVITGYPTKQTQEFEIFSKKLTPKNLVKGAQMMAEVEKVIAENQDKYSEISKPKIVDNCIKVFASTVSNGMAEGIPASFDYYEVGAPLFIDENTLNEEVGEDKIREYVYYSETHQPLLRKTGSWLMDTYNDIGYYFYYKLEEITDLNMETVQEIVTEKAEHYVIYADTCTLPQDFMEAKNITFKKIPRDIRRF